MVVFRHNRFVPTTIVDNSILSITEDDSGYLWLGTMNGISRFNPYNQKSINYQHDPAHPTSLNDDFKCYVYIDKYKTIWIGNHRGVSYFNQQTRQFSPVRILPDSLNIKPFSATSSFLEDQQGRFWIGTYSGLVLYDRKTKQAKQFVLQKGEKNKSNNNITALYCDHTGRIWVGTWGNGIALFDPTTQSFHAYKWNKSYGFEGTANIVTAIHETNAPDGNYILWAGTTEGLLKINHVPLNDQSVTWIHPDPQDPHALNDPQITSLLTNGNQILWIGTKKGINQLSSGNQRFSQIHAFTGSPTKIIVDTIANRATYFISAWYGNGLTQFDTNFHVLRTWNKVPLHATSPDNRQVSSFLRARDGSFWLATFNGLYHYNIKSGQFNSFLHKAGDVNSLASNKTTAIAEDAHGNIWIGTYGRGVDRYDPGKNLFTHFIHSATDSTSLVDNLVWSIYNDRQNKIWISTNQGISVFNEKAENFSNFFDDLHNPASLQGQEINGVLEEKDGTYWIITDKGLNHFDWHKKQFTLYGNGEGLQNDNIYAFTEDKEGTLWMSTPDGISSFNTRTKTFTNYGEQNGLANEINGPMVTLDNGMILAGGNNFILQFNPAAFRIVSGPPTVYITQLLIAGKPIVFDKPVTESGTIILAYPKNSFSCSFTAPDFFNGAAVKYAYRLSGVDADWVQAGNRNFLAYYNLAAGKYVLHIKAANSEGIWNEKGIAVNIEVLPPFWQTTWFKIMALLFLALCIYLLFAFRVRAIRKREALKTQVNKQMADMRLKVLRTRINPHFMFNALNSIQECIYTQKTETASKYLSKFSLLLRLILENSENTFITIQEEITILNLYLELESLRFDDAFSFSIQAKDVETDLLKIPPMLIQPFVENALWHGLRHKQGDKKLVIAFHEKETFIEVLIEDNGIGREAAKAMSQPESSKKQSLGISISTEQLQMMEALTKCKTTLAIEDLYSTSGEPAGTRVLLSIPVVE